MTLRGEGVRDMLRLEEPLVPRPGRGVRYACGEMGDEEKYSRGIIPRFTNMYVQLWWSSTPMAKESVG